MTDAPKPTLPTSPSGNWADDDEDENVTADDLRKRLGGFSTDKEEKAQAPAPSAAVASLASRISGLSTGDPSEPSSSPSAPAEAEKPKAKASAALFGKALAGVKTDRAGATPPAAPVSSLTSYFTPSPLANGTDTAAEPTKSSTPAPSAPPAPSSEPASEAPKPTMSHDEASAPAENNSVKMDDAVSGLISNDFQVEVKLADQQADPNSPLYSVKRFEELPIHEDLMKGIYGAGFSRPSKIQEKALPMLLHNPPRNLIGQSQSGTGKTAAFTLNMLSRVDPTLMTPQAICLAPSRELARQIQSVVDTIGTFTQIKTFLAVPGSWSRNQKIDKHILIGTPGTLVDMMSRGGRIFDAKMIRVFVLDEADEMIALQGLGDQTARIKKMLPPGVQNVLFSATFPPEVQDFAKMIAPDANQIFLKKEEITVEAIKQLYLECDSEEGKFEALSALYDCMTIGQSIVFCRRKATADAITQRLTEEHHSVASLHGDKLSNDRDDILDSFRNGKTKVLITTNVIARGIDIQQVNMVVNYDIPDLGPEGGFRPDIETYIHRIGRTGRFGRKGCSVTFVHDDRSKADLEEIMETLGKRMKRIDARNPSDLDQLDKALKLALKSIDEK